MRVAHAAPSFIELGFRREQDDRNLANLGFKSATQFAYDADTYDFFVFERAFPNSPGRTWAFAQALDPANSYTVVLVEASGASVGGAAACVRTTGTMSPLASTRTTV